jgi:purine-binding chemotaxis protein CheW
MTKERERLSEKKVQAGLRQKIEDLQRQIIFLRKQVSDELCVDEVPEDDFKLLVGRAGEHWVALYLDVIDEVVPMAKCTPIPETPEWVEGVLNLRGNSVPVLDLLSCFSQKRRKPQLNDLIVVCSFRDRRVGLIFEEILDVCHCDLESFRDATCDISHATYVIGIVHVAEKHVLVLSVPRLIVMSDIIEDEK